MVSYLSNCSIAVRIIRWSLINLLFLKQIPWLSRESMVAIAGSCLLLPIHYHFQPLLIFSFSFSLHNIIRSVSPRYLFRLEIGRGIWEKRLFIFIRREKLQNCFRYKLIWTIISIKVACFILIKTVKILPFRQAPFPHIFLNILNFMFQFYLKTFLKGGDRSWSCF